MGRWNSLVRAVVCGSLLGLVGTGVPLCAQEPANPEKNMLAAANSAGPERTLSAELLPEPAKADELPDSPGVSSSKSGDLILRASGQRREDSGSMLAQNQSSQLPETSSNANQSNQDSAPEPQKPVGTAAAEAPHASGVAASQPAGVAIAPAKQHRVRTIVIRVGAIVAAGVAVGTVVGLTEATSSKPPGSH